ncbi:MAG: L-lactate permease [Limisphaerales bacterium]
MRYLLAMIPILVVLGLMIVRRWGAHTAGMAGWLAGLAVGALSFGLTPQVFWVSQAKGLLLSAFVLAVMWPALFLFHWNDQSGGIAGVARLLEGAIPNRGMCRVLLAWSLSGLLEGLAGFGLPIAVVAPMLAALGVPPLSAVAAVAVGHSWAVTFGDMGVIIQTLVAVVGLDARALVPWAALLLGVSCLFCGLGAAAILGELRQWPKVALLSVLIGATQYGLAAAGLIPLSAFGAGLAGLVAYILCSRVKALLRGSKASGTSWRGASAEATKGRASAFETPPLVGAARINAHPAAVTLCAYGALTVLMAAITMVGPLRGWTQGLAWKPAFPGVTSRAHFSTPPGPGQVFRPLAHPGTLILVVAALSVALARVRDAGTVAAAKKAARATWRSAAAATVGVISMVGLSTLMDHCAMSFLLARGLSNLLGSLYPVVSPCVGILGAFATGSNNNSNVLFGSLQKNVALFQNINPCILVAAQTAGGSLGSMLAPVKIILGCSTVGLLGQEGRVMRQTVPCGLVLGLAVGVLTLLLCR